MRLHSAVFVLSAVLCMPAAAADPRDVLIIPGPEIAEPYVSPIHFRPNVGVLADTIPFYWKGEYHILYSNKQDCDCRDPFLFWNEEAKEHWMILCANSLTGEGPGVAVSKDLRNWTMAPALKAPSQECPDLFKIGDTWYLIGGDTYSVSRCWAMR